jgi:hypothetical protein
MGNGLCPCGLVLSWLDSCSSFQALAEEVARTSYCSLFSPLLGLSFLKGDNHLLYCSLHSKYGDIVRVGPNKLSISDPAMIPIIYGIGSGFRKVRWPNAAFMDVRVTT